MYNKIKSQNKNDTITLEKRMGREGDYPEDVRRHSCLILVIISNRPIHIVCSPKTDYLSVITAYIPNERNWENNYKKRKKP